MPAETPKIQIDESERSYVIHCSDCGHWYGFALDKYEALTVAARHEERTHPGEHQARNRLWHFKTRRETEK